MRPTREPRQRMDAPHIECPNTTSFDRPPATATATPRRHAYPIADETPTARAHPAPRASHARGGGKKGCSNAHRPASSGWK